MRALLKIDTGKTIQKTLSDVQVSSMSLSKVQEYIRIHHECEGGIEKSIPRITNWHSLVMTIGDHKGQMFLSHPHTNNRLFVLHTTKYLILYQLEKHGKDFQTILNTLRCDMVM